MTLSPSAHDHLLAFADDEHMVGSRHAAWIGMGPFLEEDLAFCSIAQDELGHALALYELLTRSDDVDRFALLRAPEDYRSCWLAEAECGEWSQALVRHWLYDRAEELRWKALTASTVPGVPEIAARALREEAFHVAHATRFMAEIANGPGRPHLEEAIRVLMPLTDGLWDGTASEPEAIAEGVVGATSADLRSSWLDLVRTDLSGWGLDPAVADVPALPGMSRLTRSEGFDEFLRGLQAVIAIDPAAAW